MLHPCFAYGSNLDPAGLAARCPRARVRGRAVLPHHELCFPVGSPDDWFGGVASVRPHPTDRVHGVLLALPAADLQALDHYEGIAEGLYDRILRPVQPEDAAHPQNAWVYIARPQPAPPPPTRAYLDVILRGARHHRLPAAWIARLAATPTRDG